LAAALSLSWLDKTSFVSPWCFWAAVTSTVIAVHLRRAEHLRGPLVPV
jgi:hypothetical protein